MLYAPGVRAAAASMAERIVEANVPPPVASKASVAPVA